MSTNVNPPPLRVPKTFQSDPETAAFISALLTVIRQLWGKVGTELLLGDGTPESPSIGFAGEDGLGIYHPEDGTIGIVSGGDDVVWFSPDGLQIFNLQPSSAVYNDASGNLEDVTLLNGSLLMGVTGGDPVANPITGTINQIAVTNGAGTITLSLPQDIALASAPTFDGLTLSGLTPQSFLYSGDGGLLTSTAAPTNGQLLIGRTGNSPVAATLTGTANQVTVTNSAGGITLSLPQSIDASNSPTFAGLTLSGTLLMSATQPRITGDMSSATIANRLAIQNSVANGNSSVLVLPNGTGTASSVLLRGSSSGANDSFGQMVIIDGSELRFSSSSVGAGVVAPMTWQFNGAEAMRLLTAGRLLINRTTDTAGAERVQIDGSLSINSAVMIRTYTAFTNGAGAALGTLANAPAAGNPTKWIPVNDNGTTRYIPAW